MSQRHDAARRRWLPSFRLLIRFRRLENKVTNARARLAWHLGLRTENPYQRPAIPAVYRGPLPRRVWMYWHQGEAAAPDLVKFCIASWRQQNPGWEVRVLDAETAPTVVSMPDLPDDISLNHRANILRMRLLEEHGGVWADATCYCARPLDHWLPVLARNGFFVFTWTKPDDAYYFPAWRRTVTNWFIASEPGGVLITKWSQQSRRYWQVTTRADHYFWHHYLFDWLCLTDRAFRDAWRAVPKLGALGPHLVLRYLESGTDEARMREALASNAVPVHKLSWKADFGVDRVRALLEPPC